MVSINEKIKQLEQDKIEDERHIVYAKSIKFLGEFPVCFKNRNH